MRTLFRPNVINHLNDSVIEMVLDKGLSCFINTWQYEKVKNYKWYAVKDGNTYYVKSSKRDGEKINIYTMHKLLTDYPEGILPDHKDGNGLNNLDENLRMSTNFQNSQNKRRTWSSQSGYRDILIKKLHGEFARID